ncbi:hypothetical protein [Ferrimicrobium acidiphilum]|jgi:hypothetical protein|uniref:hypothetical protein n=1 Tax=Ferrimicrobium acidiphilum TaxID=121039 RepID=UPI0023F13A0C|nr:hypothetical protein [Ferrimicrobium acidiphilum]
MDKRLEIMDRNHSIVIALDVDGVLLNFDEHWRRCAQECLDRPIERVAESYSLTKRFGLSKEEKLLVWKRFIDDGWMASVPPYPTSKQMVHDLRELGASLWAVSSVRETSYADRCESLRGIMPPDHVLCVGSPETRPSKAPVLERLGAQVLLDDLAIHLEDAKNVVKYPVLMDQHYVEFGDMRPAHVVQTHVEFVQLCANIVANKKVSN